VIHEKITTTEAKAKELKPYIEKLITKGKQNNVATHRNLAAVFGKGTAVKKIVEKLSPKYMDRKGGYTRVTKLAPRQTDAAKRAIIEFV
jgi:large subunit ribosomal protein L17